MCSKCIFYIMLHIGHQLLLLEQHQQKTQMTIITLTITVIAAIVLTLSSYTQQKLN